jgi:hypothetical protein
MNSSMNDDYADDNRLDNPMTEEYPYWLQ